MLLEGSSKVSEAEVLHRDLPCYWLLESLFVKTLRFLKY